MRRLKFIRWNFIYFAPEHVEIECSLSECVLDEALDHVFGYTVANDVSERTWQIKRNGGQFLLGKSFDTFLPLGPMIETQIDPGNLKISGWIDDVKMQDSNTSNLIFDVPV